MYVFLSERQRLRHLPSTGLLLKCPQQTAVGQVEARSFNLDLTYVAESQELEPSSSASQEMKQKLRSWASQMATAVPDAHTSSQLSRKKNLISVTTNEF